MRKRSEHKIRGRVVRLTRPRGREVMVEHRTGNHLRLRVTMGDIVWSVTLRGFAGDDPRIAPLRAELETARTTGDCDGAANRAIGRVGRGARCFDALRKPRRPPRRAAAEPPPPTRGDAADGDRE